MAGPKESELGRMGVTALEKCSCDSPQGMHSPDLQANGAKCEE
jgi:hypothetical protein